MRISHCIFQILMTVEIRTATKAPVWYVSEHICTVTCNNDEIIKSGVYSSLLFFFHIQWSLS